MRAQLKTIGPYLLLEPLGQGGMGVVYRALHEDGQIVALKTVRMAAETQLAGLRREIHALARLRHPGIVRILEEGISDGLPWYAMELLEGLTLRRHAARLDLHTDPARKEQRTGTAPGRPAEIPSEWWTRTLDESSAARMALQPTQGAPASETRAASGPHAWRGAAAGSQSAQRAKLMDLLSLVRRLCAPLAYLHGEGLVHRDLKLENVLIVGGAQAPDARFPDGSPWPVIVDFGLATQFGGEVSRDALGTASFAAGTVSTMAPEQIRGELLDARADLYAVGCILYELLTGRPPFVSELPAQVLWQHLNVEPEPPSRLVPDVPEPLEELVLQLLAKAPRDRLGHADDVAAALGRMEAEGGPDRGVAVHEDWPKPRAYLYRPGFAGREEAISELEPHLQSLEKGQGALVFVGGKSGIGKTRLLLELARRAERRQICVLSGECVAVDAAAEGPAARISGPLQPLRKALQTIADRCREMGVEGTERLLGRRGKVLAMYEPTLADLPGQVEAQDVAPLPAEAARMRLFSSLAETLRMLAKEQPLLLVLDDLQWADELTLGFLGFLARAVSADAQPAARLLVLGTYRTEEVGEGLRALLTLAGIRKIWLGRLAEQAVGQMVCDMLALSQSPPVFARYLSRQSEGNPFFVAEYLRTAVHEGLLWRNEDGRWQVAEEDEEHTAEEAYERLPLPPSVRDLVARHLERLGGAAQRLVEAAAVLGKEVEGSLLAIVSGLGAIETLEGTLELLGQQVMEEALAGSLRFVHDKLREVAYERLAAPRRVELHRAAAEALEALSPERREEHLAALGHHWEFAGVPDKARSCYLATARQATARFAHAEAERLYRAYLALVSQPTKESVEARNELGARILRIQGRAMDAIEQHQQALAEAHELGELAAEVQCLWKLGTLRKEIGQTTEALALYNQALALARQVGNRSDEASVLNNLGAFHYDQGHMEESCTLYEQALTIFRDLGIRSGEGISLMNLACTHVHQGRLTEGRATYEQALVIHCEAGNRIEEAHTLLNLAILHQLEVHYDETEMLCNRALAIHRETGNRRSEGIALGVLAILHRDQGRMEEAWPLFEQAVAIHRETDNPSYEGVILREMAALKRLCHGALEEAEGLVQKAEVLLGELNHVRELPACTCERGHLAMARNRPAQQLLDQAKSQGAAVKAGSDSELGQALSRLQHAVEAFDAGQHERLFRGELIEDLPEGLRRWLEGSGQLKKRDG